MLKLLFFEVVVSMALSEKSVQEFKEAYFKDYGIELSDEEAKNQAIALLRFAKACMIKPAVSIIGGRHVKQKV